MFGVGTAYGHGLYDPLPPGVFQFKWPWDPTILIFLALTFFYLRGLQKFRGRSPVKTWQKVLFFTGIVLLCLAFLPPIDPLCDQLFFVHMLQHMMIVTFGVPFMLFGVPFFIVMRGMPSWFRRRIYFPVLRNKPIQNLWRIMSKPLVAVAVFEFNLYFWHFPLFYNLALLNDGIHLVEHASFAFTALLLWRNIIDPYPMRPAPWSLPLRILLVAFMMAGNVVLSAFLTFADRVLFAYEGIPTPGWWGWGHLEDQRLGGLIMWVPGEFIDLITIGFIFFVWANREKRAESDRLQPATGKFGLATISGQQA